MTLQFSKYEGTGNDFILIDDRKLQFPANEQLISKLCDRHFGIGADGILLVQHSEGYDFGMSYYNSDGSAATFCGNGGRCITAFAHQMGICENTCRFMAADGIHHARITENHGLVKIVELDMQDPVIYRSDKNLCYLNTGTYHVVKFVDNPDNVDILESGREIRYDAGYEPHGTNVNFAKSSAIAASLKYGGNSFYVNTAGGRLFVSFTRTDDTFKNVKLTGPAKLVFEGTIEI